MPKNVEVQSLFRSDCPPFPVEPVIKMMLSGRRTLDDDRCVAMFVQRAAKGVVARLVHVTDGDAAPLAGSKTDSEIVSKFLSKLGARS
jgi:hypothetical protein